MPKKWKTGVVVGKFCPPHNGHIHLIQAAMQSCENLLVLVLSRPEPREFDSSVRANILRRTFGMGGGAYANNIGGCRLQIHSVPGCLAPDNHYDSDAEQKRLTAEAVRRHKKFRKPDVVFTSESYGPSWAEYLGCEHAMFDLDRKLIPISATIVRNEPYDYFQYLPKATQDFYKYQYIDKVAFMGAESTGKSTISKALAVEYGSRFTHEVGRDACEGDKYHSIDTAGMVQIATDQEKLENDLIASGTCKHYLFCDTTAITTEFYSYEYNDECDPIVHEKACEVPHRYKHIFLCGIDIPFEDDGTRRLGGKLRKLHQSMVKMQLDWYEIEYTELHGPLHERMEKVIEVIEARKQEDYFNV